jgi:2-C-methyl-D-erythritol 2,4-cyclodiphosphate synthase
MRVGFGFDIHRLVAGRRLVLGGVAIPFEKGLLGHSDADVVLHAVCDALLGAAGLGDIGEHFPDHDPQFKDVSSMELLTTVFGLIEQGGFAVNNVDVTALCEAPKLASYKSAMASSIAGVLNLKPGRVTIKATTMEGLGAIGKGDAIAAMCVATLSARVRST